jgi:alpha/beta superfamily hydrolase
MSDPSEQQWEPVTIDAGPGRTLEGVLSWPRAGARGGAVVCHPHPQYGGAMDNGVVVATCDALHGRGFATLRFNFGGVGRSQGAYGGGPEEIEDTGAAIAMLGARLPPALPLVLVGYSFGAWVALHAAARQPQVRHVVAIAPPLDFFDWRSVGIVQQSVSIIVAARDQFCDSARLASVLREHAAHVDLAATIPGTDHFFGGFEAQVGAACATACAGLS